VTDDKLQVIADRIKNKVENCNINHGRYINYNKSLKIREVKHGMV